MSCQHRGDSRTARETEHRRKKEVRTARSWGLMKRTKKRHHQESHQSAGCSPDSKQQGGTENLGKKWPEFGVWREHEHLDMNFERTHQYCS